MSIEILKIMLNFFFKGDHTIEIPSSYGKLKETIINGRIMTLRYTKSSVHKLVFIDLIENRCLRVLTVKDI